MQARVTPARASTEESAASITLVATFAPVPADTEECLAKRILQVLDVRTCVSYIWLLV